jgi:hypothetical protein
MAIERASVFEVSQLGAETTPGTAVPALKRLLCTTLRLDPNIPVEPYRPMGYKAPTAATHGKESCGGSLEGRACFNDLCYLMSSVLCAPVISTPGGATSTRRWTFKPKVSSPDTVQTYTFERGNALSGAERATFGRVNGLSLRFNETEAAVTGSLIAQEPDYSARMSGNEVQRLTIQDNATGGTFKVTFGGQETAAIVYNVTASAFQTALEALSSIGAGNVLVTAVSAGVYDIEFTGALGQTNVALLVVSDNSLLGAIPPPSAVFTTPTAGVAPTEIPEVVMDSDRVSVWTGADVAGLARLRRVQEIEWGVSDRFAPNFNLDDEEPSFSNLVERGMGAAGQVTMQRNDDARTLLAYMRAKTTRMWRVQVLGPNIEAGFPHKLWITWPEKARDLRHGSAQEVETGQFELFNVYDATFAGWVEVVIDCALTSL